MKYHMIAFFMGFLLDQLLGDPYFLPHPIRLIGKLISGTEKRLRRKIAINETDKSRSELRQGAAMVLIVLASVVMASGFLLFAAYRIHPYVGMAIESLMTYQILAMKCLRVESMKVYHCLRKGSLEKARTAVSMIVGRDTEHLDEEDVAKAAIETVAENTSDGVIAPMLYLAIGGPILGFLYKAINTMDSMIGYKNEKYLYFGRAAAKLDDFVNYLPARISALLMIAASYCQEVIFQGKAHGKFTGGTAENMQVQTRRRQNPCAPVRFLSGLREMPAILVKPLKNHISGMHYARWNMKILSGRTI